MAEFTRQEREQIIVLDMLQTLIAKAMYFHSDADFDAMHNVLGHELSEGYEDHERDFIEAYIELLKAERR